MIGIYCITNTINGKKYIGQSWNIERRWYEHKNSKRKDHLRLAFNKYGIDAFDFSILRKFSNSGLTQIFLDTFERKYIIEMKTYDRQYGYNKNTGGGSASIVNDEVRGKISKSNTGKKRSPEVIEKYRKATLKYLETHQAPSTGIAVKEETKRKISKSLKGRPWPKDRNNSYCGTKEYSDKLSIAHVGLAWSKKRWEAHYKKYGYPEGYKPV
jgi:group I intron endonuclease